jgi:hypothetical protein
MDAFEAVRTLLAVRSYQDKPITEDSLRRILEAMDGTLSFVVNHSAPGSSIIFD